MRHSKKKFDLKIAYGDPDVVPCPYCGKYADVQRRLWGYRVNYCNTCRRLFDVLPEELKPKGMVSA